MNVLENVYLPLINSGKPIKEIKEKAIYILNKVGLGERLYNKPSEISGGQQQRVAIARALIKDPLVIFADEPTANLDSKTSIEILELMLKMNQEGVTFVFSTHDLEVISYAKREIKIRDGQIVGDIIKNA